MILLVLISTQSNLSISVPPGSLSSRMLGWLSLNKLGQLNSTSSSSDGPVIAVVRLLGHNQCGTLRSTSMWYKLAHLDAKLDAPQLPTSWLVFAFVCVFVFAGSSPAASAPLSFTSTGRGGRLNPGSPPPVRAPISNSTDSPSPWLTQR